MGSILPCFFPFGKAGGLQILRCQGIAVGYYGFTLDALTLKPSDFCNVGVNQSIIQWMFPKFPGGKKPPRLMPAAIDGHNENGSAERES